MAATPLCDKSSLLNPRRSAATEVSVADPGEWLGAAGTPL